MPRYKIAGVIIDAGIRYRYTANLCKNYEYSGTEPADLTVNITDEDIAFEKAFDSQFPDPYLEGLSLFRKLCDYLLKRGDGIIFHSSAVAVDGKAYLFTAPSGTGKSTHTRLWREMLGDRAVMVNDDKPIIIYRDGKFFVCGTPWNGKHHLDTNVEVEIKAICNIYQAKENVIRRASAGEMLLVIMNQTIRPSDPTQMDNLLSLIDKLLKQTALYKLGCNISREASELSFTTMSEGK